MRLSDFGIKHHLRTLILLALIGISASIQARDSKDGATADPRGSSDISQSVVDPTVTTPFDAAKVVAEADTAYAHADYDKAAALYEQVVEREGVSGAILYNLGNAYYKSGNEGEARLCLERAKRLDPSNKLISQNIQYLASRIEDANKAEMKGKKGSVAPDPTGFFGRIHNRIAVDTSSDAWAEMAAMAFVLLVLAIALYLFSHNVRMKKIGFFSAIIFLFFSVVFVVFAEMAASSFEARDEAVLMQFKLTLSSEPQQGAPAVGFPLHRGTKFHILDSELNPDGEIGWYKVQLNSNNVGWLPADAIEII